MSAAYKIVRKRSRLGDPGSERRRLLIDFVPRPESGRSDFGLRRVAHSLLWGTSLGYRGQLYTR